MMETVIFMLVIMVGIRFIKTGAMGFLVMLQRHQEWEISVGERVLHLETTIEMEI